MGHDIFISGGTGYVGASLIPQLLARGHRVTALAREKSAARVPALATVSIGDALSAQSIARGIRPADTYVHLTGTPHPAPWKRDQFRTVDLVSLQASVAAASAARIQHFVYISVAHPAPVMKDYIEVRMECEGLLRASGLSATILRPWYVLGPGHRWPSFLKPLYAVAERVPAVRSGALRLGLVTRDQMVAAMIAAIEHPPAGVRVLDVPAIKAGEGLARAPRAA